MSKNIIGVIGFIGSGKDTVGDYIVNEFNFTRDSFAKPLKDCVSAVFGWDRQMLEGVTKEDRMKRDQPDEWWENRLNWEEHEGYNFSKRFTPRVALQLWGTEVLRLGFHDDIWIASLENRIKDSDNIVITDCRFPNEIQTIKKLGGKIIRVKRGPEPSWYETAKKANIFYFQNNSNDLSRDLIEASDALVEMERSNVHASEWHWVGAPFDEVIENDGTLEELENKIKCFMNSNTP